MAEPSPGPTGRTHAATRVAAVVGLVVLLVGAAVVALVLREDTYTAPRPSPTTGPAAPQPRPDEAERALRGLVSSLAAGDAGAAATLAPRGDAQAADLLAAVARNAEALRVTDLAARYVDEVGPVAPDGRWQAAVELTWRFDGFDARPATEEVQVGFAPGPDAGDPVGVATLGGGDERTPLWLTGPLRVRRTPTTLVLVAGPSSVATTFDRRARLAVPVVRRVLPDWPGRLVLEVPADQQQLDAALDAPAGTYDDIAAVTSSVDGSSEPGTPIHVFVNRDVFDALDRVGAQVVVSHEATHVATRAPLSRMPLWLVEGFADYVALRDVDLPLSVTAGQVLDEVRADGPPEELPSAADFADASDALGAVYESAWIACRLVVERGGQDDLVRLYRRTDAGADLDAGLRRLLGLDLAAFTRAWRDELVDLAG